MTEIPARMRKIWIRLSLGFVCSCKWGIKSLTATYIKLAAEIDMIYGVALVNDDMKKNAKIAPARELSPENMFNINARFLV